MNASERLSDAARWFADQGADLADRVRNAFDAMRLYDFAQSHPRLPRLASQWDEAAFIEAIGYNPADVPDISAAPTSGATEAAAALVKARNWLDSVTFASREGDTEGPIRAIDAVLRL